ncbi:MAG: HlyD family secretion protein [Planctomycetales bacterium]|nr:HlyD family secretion protein [Planctomycetales bacterium]
MNDSLQQTVRLRPDIQWSKFVDGMRSIDESQLKWVARDPISLEYYYFNAFEKTVACMLDGTKCLADVLAASRERSVTADWILQFVAKLEHASLLVPREPILAGKRLWQSRIRQARVGSWQKLLSPLAVRVSLLDPTRLLDMLATPARVLFSTTFFLLWSAAALVVAVLVLQSWLQSPTSIMDAILQVTTSQVVGLVLVYVCVKSLHELGHAMACKRWGAECHEIGLFFLVFTPILYCNTSDSWRLSSKWKRAAIAAAGIYIELILASCGGVVWLVTRDSSAIHMMAANVMVICSVSTLAINANPLLRYDGYYVLSDLWTVPNLAEQGKEAAWTMSLRLLTLKPVPPDRWDGDYRWLAFYGAASWFYRQFVVVMIAWVVWILLDGLGLSLLGAFLAILSLTTVVISNLRGSLRWSKQLIAEGGFHGKSRYRTLFLCATMAIIVVAIFFAPLPTSVSARALTQLQSQIPVYAKRTAILQDFASVGSNVQAGQILVNTESLDLELELLDARGNVAALRQRVTQLQLHAVNDESTAIELANVAAELAKAEDRLKILHQEFETLTVLAEQAGRLMPADFKMQPTLAELPNADSLKPLLTRSNIGKVVERGELLGWLGKNDELQIVALVAEQDAKLLWQGMSVTCRWDCEAGSSFSGTVIRISPEPVGEIPDALIGDPAIAGEAIGFGSQHPRSPHYEVRVGMQEIPRTAGQYSLANVRFRTAPRTLFRSFQRLLDINVRPQL